MSEQIRERLIGKMTDNLPVLRRKLGLNQDELGQLVGVSRSTLATIETHKHTMSWNLFLSLVLVFSKNKETERLMNALEIGTGELDSLIAGPGGGEKKTEK